MFKYIEDLSFNSGISEIAFRIGLDKIVEPSDFNLNNSIRLGKAPSRQYLTEKTSLSKRVK